MSRRDIVNTLAAMVGATEVVVVDSFIGDSCRHICKGFTTIIQLNKCYIDVPIPVNGARGSMYPPNIISVEYYLCGNCRKLIVNKESFI